MSDLQFTPKRHNLPIFRRTLFPDVTNEVGNEGSSIVKQVQAVDWEKEESGGDFFSPTPEEPKKIEITKRVRDFLSSTPKPKNTEDAKNEESEGCDFYTTPQPKKTNIAKRERYFPGPTPMPKNTEDAKNEESGGGDILKSPKKIWFLCLFLALYKKYRKFRYGF